MRTNPLATKENWASLCKKQSANEKTKNWNQKGGYPNNYDEIKNPISQFTRN